ncbi:unnamed protein product [Urochloa humidicola]
MTGPTSRTLWPWNREPARERTARAPNHPTEERTPAPVLASSHTATNSDGPTRIHKMDICRAVGAPLYPSVPLWTFVAGSCFALPRAMSILGVPQVVVRNLPTMERSRTVPPAPAPSLVVSDSNDDDNGGDVSSARRQPRSSLPSLGEIITEEEHEVSLRRRRVRRKRVADSAKKIRRSSRLAAKEEPFYENATDRASRIKAAKLDLAKASEQMKAALAASGILERPPPPRIAARKLRCLGRVCGLPHLSEVEDEVDLHV